MGHATDLPGFHHRHQSRLKVPGIFKVDELPALPELCRWLKPETVQTDFTKLKTCSSALRFRGHASGAVRSEGLTSLALRLAFTPGTATDRQ